mgnify:CR=1 FL=1
MFNHKALATSNNEPKKLTLKNQKGINPDFSTKSVPAKYCASNQGNFLKGIENKTIRMWGFRKMHTLFTYVLFLVTHPTKQLSIPLNKLPYRRK